MEAAWKKPVRELKLTKPSLVGTPLWTHCLTDKTVEKHKILLVHSINPKIHIGRKRRWFCSPCSIFLWAPAQARLQPPWKMSELHQEIGVKENPSQDGNSLLYKDWPISGNESNLETANRHKYMQGIELRQVTQLIGFVFSWAPEGLLTSGPKCTACLSAPQMLGRYEVKITHDRIANVTRVIVRQKMDRAQPM